VLNGTQNIMENEDLHTKIEKLENEVLEELEGNPFRTYKCEFPYSVRFQLEEDPLTEIIINTRSEEFFYAKTEKDVLQMKELSDSHSHISLSKYIIKYMDEQLWTVDAEKCDLTFTGKPIINELTEAELEDFQRKVLSANEYQ